MKIIARFVPAFAIAIMLLISSGCTRPTNVDPVVHTQQISSLIHSGTQTAVAFGLTAIPDKAEADQIANEAYKIINNEVLPALSGDDIAISNALKDILALKAFNDPKLVKAKVIIEAALPLVVSYIPSDVLSGQTKKIPDDIKSYLVSFFSGVNDGCSSYLGGVPVQTRELKKIDHKVDFRSMREKLATK